MLKKIYQIYMDGYVYSAPFTSKVSLTDALKALQKFHAESTFSVRVYEVVFKEEYEVLKS